MWLICLIVITLYACYILSSPTSHRMKTRYPLSTEIELTPPDWSVHNSNLREHIKDNFRNSLLLREKFLDFINGIVGVAMTFGGVMATLTNLERIHITFFAVSEIALVTAVIVGVGMRYVLFWIDHNKIKQSLIKACDLLDKMEETDAAYNNCEEDDPTNSLWLAKKQADAAVVNYFEGGVPIKIEIEKIVGFIIIGLFTIGLLFAVLAFLFGPSGSSDLSSEGIFRGSGAIINAILPTLH